ncbi:hypothetical protein ABPG74_012772 [Tetrahymena malaccensis]
MICFADPDQTIKKPIKGKILPFQTFKQASYFTYKQDESGQIQSEILHSKKDCSHGQQNERIDQNNLLLEKEILIDQEKVNKSPTQINEEKQKNIQREFDLQKIEQKLNTSEKSITNNNKTNQDFNDQQQEQNNQYEECQFINITILVDLKQYGMQFEIEEQEDQKNDFTSSSEYQFSKLRDINNLSYYSKKLSDFINLPEENLILTKYKNNSNEEEDVFIGNLVQQKQSQEIILKVLYNKDEKYEVEKEIQIIRAFEQEYNRDILIRYLEIQNNNHLILLNKEMYCRIEKSIDTLKNKEIRVWKEEEFNEKLSQKLKGENDLEDEFIKFKSFQKQIQLLLMKENVYEQMQPRSELLNMLKCMVDSMVQEEQINRKDCLELHKYIFESIMKINCDDFLNRYLKEKYRNLELKQYDQNKDMPYFQEVLLYYSQVQLKIIQKLVQ